MVLKKHKNSNDLFSYNWIELSDIIISNYQQDPQGTHKAINNLKDEIDEIINPELIQDYLIKKIDNYKKKIKELSLQLMLVNEKKGKYSIEDYVNNVEYIKEFEKTPLDYLLKSNAVNKENIIDMDELTKYLKTKENEFKNKKETINNKKAILDENWNNLKDFEEEIDNIKNDLKIMSDSIFQIDLVNKCKSFINYSQEIKSYEEKLNKLKSIAENFSINKLKQYPELMNLFEKELKEEVGISINEYLEISKVLMNQEVKEADTHTLLAIKQRNEPQFLINEEQDREQLLEKLKPIYEIMTKHKQVMIELLSKKEKEQIRKSVIENELASLTNEKLFKNYQEIIKESIIDEDDKKGLIEIIEQQKISLEDKILSGKDIEKDLIELGLTEEILRKFRDLLKETKFEYDNSKNELYNTIFNYIINPKTSNIKDWRQLLNPLTLNVAREGWLEKYIYGIKDNDKINGLEKISDDEKEKLLSIISQCWFESHFIEVDDINEEELEKIREYITLKSNLEEKIIKQKIGKDKDKKSISDKIKEIKERIEIIKAGIESKELKDYIMAETAIKEKEKVLGSLKNSSQDKKIEKDLKEKIKNFEEEIDKLKSYKTRVKNRLNNKYQKDIRELLKNQYNDQEILEIYNNLMYIKNEKIKDFEKELKQNKFEALADKLELSDEDKNNLIKGFNNYLNNESKDEIKEFYKQVQKLIKENKKFSSLESELKKLPIKNNDLYELITPVWLREFTNKTKTKKQKLKDKKFEEEQKEKAIKELAREFYETITLQPKKEYVINGDGIKIIPEGKNKNKILNIDEPRIKIVTPQRTTTNNYTQEATVHEGPKNTIILTGSEIKGNKLKNITLDIILNELKDIKFINEEKDEGFMTGKTNETKPFKKLTKKNKESITKQLSKAIIESLENLNNHETIIKAYKKIDVIKQAFDYYEQYKENIKNKVKSKEKEKGEKLFKELKNKLKTSSITKPITWEDIKTRLRSLNLNNEEIVKEKLTALGLELTDKRVQEIIQHYQLDNKIQQLKNLSPAQLKNKYQQTIN